MDIPQGVDPAEGKSKRFYALVLHDNVYGQKQAAWVLVSTIAPSSGKEGWIL